MANLTKYGKMEFRALCGTSSVDYWIWTT